MTSTQHLEAVLKPVQYLTISFLVDNTIEWLAESNIPQQLR